MNLEFSPRFRELVHEQLDIITRAKYPEDASRWFDGLIEKISVLSTFPEAGRLSRVPDLADKGIREIVYSTFIAYYVIDGDTCKIISLRRFAMNIRSPKDL